MKITGIEAYLLSYPLPEPVTLTYFGGERTILKRDAMLIRVSTDQGIFGYAPGQASVKSKQTIDTLIAPFLLGRTLADPDALRIMFQQGPGADAEVSKVYSAVEIALYDVVGKARNMPVRGYVSCVLGCPYEGAIAPAAVAHLAQALLELGADSLSIATNSLNDGNVR